MLSKSLFIEAEVFILSTNENSKVEANEWMELFVEESNHWENLHCYSVSLLSELSCMHMCV